jgi:hypothetical protein
MLFKDKVIAMLAQASLRLALSCRRYLPNHSYLDTGSLVVGEHALYCPKPERTILPTDITKLPKLIRMAFNTVQIFVAFDQTPTLALSTTTH